MSHYQITDRIFKLERQKGAAEVEVILKQSHIARLEREIAELRVKLEAAIRVRGS